MMRLIFSKYDFNVQVRQKKIWKKKRNFRLRKLLLQSTLYMKYIIQSWSDSYMWWLLSLLFAHFADFCSFMFFCSFQETFVHFTKFLLILPTFVHFMFFALFMFSLILRNFCSLCKFLLILRTFCSFYLFANFKKLFTHFMLQFSVFQRKEWFSRDLIPICIYINIFEY